MHGRGFSLPFLADRCVNAQPLMYGAAPFYSMPFPYPPATSGAQLEAGAAGGSASGAAQKKAQDSNGPAKSGDNASNPVSTSKNHLSVDCRQPVAVEHRLLAGIYLVHLGLDLSRVAISTS